MFPKKTLRNPDCMGTNWNNISCLNSHIGKRITRKHLYSYLITIEGCFLLFRVNPHWKAEMSSRNCKGDIAIL